MRALFLVTISVFFSFQSYSQTPIQWQMSLGGSGGDTALSIQQINDGGYILAGYSDSFDGDVTGNHGGYDYWIVKLAMNGNMVWQKSFGGSKEDIATSIEQTNDGGYIIAGNSRSTDGDVTNNHGGYDYWIVKIDENGDLIWQNSFGGSDEETALSVHQTNDDGYIVGGTTASTDGDVTNNHGEMDYWVIKLDTNGNLIWQKSFGGSDYDIARSVQQTDDNSYIVAGKSYSTDGDVTENHGDADYWIVKLDMNGNLSWQQTLGGSSGDRAYSIEQTNDGGYIVAGDSRSIDGDVTGNHGWYDCWVVKLDSNGSLVWQKSFGGTGGDFSKRIRQTDDNGYILAAWSYSTDGDVTGNHGSYDYWIVKMDIVGSLVWQKSFGGSSRDVTSSIQQTDDGGYVVAGSSESIDGDVIGNHGSWDYWIVKLDTTIGVAENIVDTNVLVYPNPSIGQIDIKTEGQLQQVTIYDILGNICFLEYFTGEISTDIDISQLANGVYILDVVGENGKTNQTKIIKN